jgi:hypothetical protein
VEMAAYYMFYLHLIFFLFSIVAAIIFIARKDFDNLAAMVLLFFGCFIGMCCNYPAWVRVFSAMYGIVWNG